MTSNLLASARTLCVLVASLACGACGATSDDHDATSAGGGSGAAGGSNTGGDQSSGGTSNTGGASSSSGASSAGGGQSSGGTSSVGGGSAGSAASGAASMDPGTITDTWRDFCVATFTEDYMATDAFGDPLFTAKAGEEYLLTDYPTPYRSATAAYLTSSGPLEFGIEPNADFTSFPFTSNCSPDPPLSYFAVFADVSVYAEAELVTKLCDLEAGDAVLRDTMTGAGYGLDTIESGFSIYEVFLNAFSAQCGGAANGFVSVPIITLFGSDRVLVPFEVIAAE